VAVHRRELLEDAGALAREPQVDLAPVLGCDAALDEPLGLEPVDEADRAVVLDEEHLRERRDRERLGFVAGLDGADSWTTDAHKWLNVPYDCGIVAVADPEAHLAAMSFGAAYYVTSGAAVREPGNWVAESSRRSRAFTVYAALRELGRDGLADLVDRCCALARRMADGLRGAPGVTILNEVALNQVLVRFAPPAGGTDADADDFTRRVIAAVQADGTCWLGGTTWHDMAAMRISVSNWSTTEQDADVSVAAIRRCAAAVAARWAPAASPAAV